VVFGCNKQGKTMTSQQRKQLAERLEQKIGDMLRAEGIAMDGFMCREVDDMAKTLAAKAILKRERTLAETT
jgi:hypothetical protein